MDVVLAMVVATVIALALLWFGARSAITICIAEVRDGKLLVTHGGVDRKSVV